MKRYILCTLMLIGTVGLVLAQDDDQTASDQESDKGYAPSAGDLSGAILFGRGLFIDPFLNVPTSVTPNSNVTGSSPTAYNVIGEDNSAVNMIGGEARYFILDNIAIKLGGAGIVRNTPDQPNAPAPTGQLNNSAAAIPNYAAVIAENEVYIAVNLGGEYHFDSKYDRLFPYLGINIPYHYARYSLYDPTISGGASPVIVDVGPRHSELQGFGLQAAAGVDYYLQEGLYFGFEIKPISFLHVYERQLPAPGLEERQATTSTWSFLTQPFLKIGFRF